MKKELDVVPVDGKEYFIMNRVTYHNNTYVYLSRDLDDSDVLIKKLDKKDKTNVVPLDDIDEFELACNLLIKKLLLN